MVRCPLVNREIDEDDCFLTATAIEGVTPLSDALPDAMQVPDKQSICMGCTHHPQ